MTMLTKDQVHELAKLAQRNGTLLAFTNLALDWIDQADAEISRLRKQLAEMENEPSRECEMDTRNADSLDPK